MRAECITSRVILLIVLLTSQSKCSKMYDNVFDDSQNTVSRHSMHSQKRATDSQLSSEVERMQKIARLATGISLQVGLNDGSIPSDSLVSGLLLLGKTTPSQIVSMDAPKLQKALTSLKELPDKLASDASSRNVEEKLKTMHEVRTMVESFDVTNWEGRQDFEKDMRTVKENGSDLTDVLAVHGKVNAWTIKLQDIKDHNFDASNQDSVQRTKFSFDDINKLSTDLRNLLNKLVAIKTKPWTYPKMKSTTDALKPVNDFKQTVKAVDAKKTILHIDSAGENDFSSYSTKLRTLSDASAAVNGVLPSFQILNSIARVGKTSVAASLGYAGFANGVGDIDNMFVDLRDEWIQKVVDVDKVAASLKPLQSLIPAFKKVRKDLGLSSKPQSQKIQKLLEIIDGVRAVPSDPKDVDVILQSYVNCGKKFNPQQPPDFNLLKPLFQAAADLDGKMKAVDDLVEKLIGFLNEDKVKSWLEKVKELTVDPKDDTQVGATLTNLKQSPEVENLRMVMENAKALSFDIPVKEVKQAADVTLIKTSSFDNFLISISTYTELFQCLQAIENQKTETMTKTENMIRKFAKLQKTVISDGETIVASVTNTSNEFKTLDGIIGSMKGKSKAQSNVFRTLPEPKKHSETIGAATRGISAMETAMGKNDITQVVIQNAGLVSLHLNKPKLSPTDKANLNKIGQLKTALETMNQKLEEWRKSVKESSSPALVSHSELFTLASKVPGVTMDLGELAKSVDKLASIVVDPTARSELASLKNALDSLASLDLDFAAYSAPLLASKDSLSALDLFFASSRTNSPPSATNSPAGSLNPTTQNSTDDGSIFSWTFLVMIFFIFTTCIVLAGSSIYIYRSHLENGTLENKLSENKKGSTVPVTSQTVSASKPVFSSPQLSEKSARAISSRFFSSNIVCEQKTLDQTQREVEVLSCNRGMYEEFITNLGVQLKKAWSTLQYLPDPDQYNAGHGIAHLCTCTAGAVNMTKNKPLHVFSAEDTAQTRKSTPLLEETRIILEGYAKGQFVNNFTHASTVTFLSGKRFILTQAPMQECREGKTITKYSTIEKFYWMIKQLGADKVVNLCGPSLKECSLYFPKEKGDVEKFDKLRVTCLSKTITKDGITIRELSFKFDGCKELNVTHYQMNESWTEELPPSSVEPVLSLLKMVNGGEAPVIVHCEDGVTLSGSFAHIEMCRLMVCKNGALHFNNALFALQRMRVDAVENPLRLAFVYVAVMTKCRTEAGEKEGEREKNVFDAYELFRKQGNKKCTTIKQSLIAPAEHERVVVCTAEHTVQKLLTTDTSTNGVPVPPSDLYTILKGCVVFFQSSNCALVELDGPVSICGDTHGQLSDVLCILKKIGPLSKSNKLMFLGDYVDRGSFSIEVMVLLFSLKLVHPGNVILLRGNHEIGKINRCYGFHAELKSRYCVPATADTPGSEQIFAAFNQVFSWMPLVALISKRILCMHGGISPHLNSMKDIRAIPLPMDDVKVHPLACDLLWSDPDETVEGFAQNKNRGVSCIFGAKAVQEACKKLHIELIVRAHQVVSSGYSFFANKRLLTIFSASRYSKGTENYAAIAKFDENLNISFTQFKPAVNELLDHATDPITRGDLTDKMKKEMEEMKDEMDDEA